MSGLLDSPRSKTKKKIVYRLLGGEKTLKELSSYIGISKQALLKHLDKMQKKGIVVGVKEKGNKGNVKKYRIGGYSAVVSVDEEGFVVEYECGSPIDFRFPLVNQIPQIKYRREVLKYLEGILSLGKKLAIVVFGSVARGEASWKSDIDVVFFSGKWIKKEEEEILDKITETSLRKDIEVSMNPHFKTYRDLEKKGGLEEEIKKDGVIIYTNQKKEKLWTKMKKYGNT